MSRFYHMHGNYLLAEYLLYKSFSFNEENTHRNVDANRFRNSFLRLSSFTILIFEFFTFSQIYDPKLIQDNVFWCFECSYILPRWFWTFKKISEIFKKSSKIFTFSVLCVAICHIGKSSWAESLAWLNHCLYHYRCLEVYMNWSYRMGFSKFRVQVAQPTNLWN